MFSSIIRDNFITSPCAPTVTALSAHVHCGNMVIHSQITNPHLAVFGSQRRSRIQGKNGAGRVEMVHPVGQAVNLLASPATLQLHSCAIGYSQVRGQV